MRIVLLQLHDDQRYNENLRIEYLRNRITKEDFQRKIEQRNKKTEKKRENNDVIRMLVTTVTDILFRFKDSLMKYDRNTTPNNLKFIDDCFSIFNEIDGIVSYTNECFEDVGKTYNSKPLKIHSFRNYDAFGEGKYTENLLYRNTVEHSEAVYTGVKMGDPQDKPVYVTVYIPENAKDNCFQILVDGRLVSVKANKDRKPGDLVNIEVIRKDTNTNTNDQRKRFDTAFGEIERTIGEIREVLGGNVNRNV